MFKDPFVFGIYLLLIAAFLLFLKKYFGIELQPRKFMEEVRKLLSLTPTPETINALGMVLLALIILLVLCGILAQGLRTFVYFLLVLDPKDLPSIPWLTICGLLLGVFLIAFLCSQVYCDRHARVLLELERLRQTSRARRPR